MTLRLREAVVRRGGFRLAADFELAMEGVTVVFGPSGGGKSSLLSAIAGIHHLETGSLTFNGRMLEDVRTRTRVPAHDRGIGLVFQDARLFPHLTVKGNLAYAESRRPAARNAPIVIEIARRLQFETLLSRPVRNLSGGEKARVALARAIVSAPELLLLDEPFSALDESFRVPLRRSFRQLQRALGQSCVLVTHDRDEAFELADQVAVMVDGRIEQCSPPGELWQRPRSLRVADFLGAFNRLDARTAPAPWRRDSGCWIAPLAALQGAGPGTPPDAWRLDASVRAAHPGRTHTSVALLAPGEQELTLTLPPNAPVPAPGTLLRLALPATALQWLPG